MVATQRPGAKVSRSLTIEQTPEGYTSLLHQLQTTGSVPGQVLVVMEATGISQLVWLRVSSTKGLR